MSSWRDDPDPHCPECGEPISPTSRYCMHCYADFDDSERASTGSGGGGSGTADVDPTDDWTRDRESGSDGKGVVRTLARYLVRRGREVGSGPEGHDRTDRPARRERSERDRPDSGSALDRTDRSEEAVAAPFWTRGLASFLVSIPVTLLAFLILSEALGSVTGSTGGLLPLTVWGLTFAYLVRKPLPSDIVGDALYVLAGLILVGPVVGYAILVLRAAVTDATLQKSLAALAGELLVVEFVLLWPAAILAGIGKVGNWWAAKQLRTGDGTAE